MVKVLFKAFILSSLTIILLVLQSCNTQQKVGTLVYFNQQGDTSLAKIVQDAEPRIQVGDRLSIVVNAANPVSAAPYNIGAGVITGAATGGYVVESDGAIQFPQLGKIIVAGMKRKQLVDTLTNKLVTYVNDPLVIVQFTNFKITVLGEVGKPGSLNIPDGKVTIIDAIGLAGDLPITARRDNILIIREKNGQREFGHINLLSKNTFSSPYYILQQNDVVYVELNNEKVATATQQTFTRNLSIGTAILSVIGTLTILVINLTR